MFACITVPLVCPLFPREKLFNALIDPAVNYLVTKRRCRYALYVERKVVN